MSCNVRSRESILSGPLKKLKRMSLIRLLSTSNVEDYVDCIFIILGSTIDGRITNIYWTVWCLFQDRT